MDSRNEIRDFLASRRARITPEQAGLPAYGGNRRVTGLRREEVALLAGVSVDYYTRLERGNARGVSDGVLEALARALQLDEAERAHLFDLVHAADTTTRTRRRPAKQQVRPSVRRILDAMTTAPAYARNGRLDILAANQLGKALFSPIFADPTRPGPAGEYRPVHLPQPPRQGVLRRLGPGLHIPRRAEPPRKLGGHPRPGRDDPPGRPHVSGNQSRSSQHRINNEATMEILSKQPTVKGPAQIR